MGKRDITGNGTCCTTSRGQSFAQSGPSGSFVTAVFCRNSVNVAIRNVWQRCDD